MAAVSGPVSGQAAYLWEGDRQGTFIFDSSNLASQVSSDTLQGVYIAPASASTGASGAWVRKFSGDVNAHWFGAVGNDAADNAVPLQRAYDWAAANDRSLYIPGGLYRSSATINWNVNNTRVYGDGWLTTIIKPTTANPAVIISARYSQFYGIGVDGVIAGTYGFIMKDGGSTTLEWCDARNFDNDGLYFDPTWGGGATGNNNISKVVGGSYNLNGRNGIRLLSHGDNNGISFYNVNCSSNTSHGMLAKSQGGYVDPGCIFEGNGGYGLQIGEDGDGSASTDWLIDCPWAEANTSGDFRSSAQSGSNRWKLMSAAQTYSRHASASDTVDRVTAGLWQFGSQDGSTFVQASANTTSAFLAAAGTGNINLRLSGAGTGVVQVDDDLTVTGSATANGVNVNGTGGTFRFLKWQSGGVDSNAYYALSSDNVTLSYNSPTAGGSHIFQVNSANIATIQGTGINLDAGKVLLVNGLQVVGARKTGWATATGTATRTTFDTTTVTTQQLAERVKALIDDLHATAGTGLLGT